MLRDRKPQNRDGQDALGSISIAEPSTGNVEYTVTEAEGAKNEAHLLIVEPEFLQDVRPGDRQIQAIDICQCSDHRE